MQQTEWVYCPICGNKTRDRIREDTVLINYPLYCPKCKRESLIQAEKLHIVVLKEPEVVSKLPSFFIVKVTFYLDFSEVCK